MVAGLGGAKAGTETESMEEHCLLEHVKLVTPVISPLRG